MKTRGILFQPEMVRQLRLGNKRQTRRILRGPLDLRLCPYGQPGDQLAVREAWRALREFDHLKPRELPEFNYPIWYEADGAATASFGRYRHGRFMPLRLSRNRFTICSVKIELVRDISEADAIAEGFASRADFFALWDRINGPGNPHVWVLSL